ncbi:unnamed protein product [Ambrosiozyma monospora]|uniref:Unnamed protein product n=1 Tax=Ambrosiozyma monospora TaxID=43982 RepID=A0ACB5TUH6_AMBMO|nr:unnamed protein product [Ambrosiozyma monospora]
MLKLLPRQELNLNCESSITCSIVKTYDFIDPSGNPINMSFKNKDKRLDSIDAYKHINSLSKKGDPKPNMLHPLTVMPSKPKEQAGLRVEIQQPAPAQVPSQNSISLPARMPLVPFPNTSHLIDQKTINITNNHDSTKSSSDMRASLSNEDKHESLTSLQIDSSSTMTTLQSLEAHSMVLVPITKPSEPRSEAAHTQNSRTSSISSIDYLHGTQGSRYRPDDDRHRSDRYIPERKPSIHNDENGNDNLRSTYSPSSVQFPSRGSYSPPPGHTSARPLYTRIESPVPPSPANRQYTPSPPPRQLTHSSYSVKSESPSIPQPQRELTPVVPIANEKEYDYFKQDCIQCPYCCIIHPRKRHLMTCEPCGLVHPEGLHTYNLPSGVGYCGECLMAHPIGSAHPKITGKSMIETIEIRNRFPAKKALLLMEKRRKGLAKTGKFIKHGKQKRGGKRVKAARVASKIRK